MVLLKNKSVALGIIAMCIVAACQSSPKKNELNPNAYRAAMNDKKDEILIDVRTPEEYKEGHLADAVNINWEGEAFMDEVAKLDKSKPVFLYCRTARRSGEAAEALKNNGFTEVYVLDGGVLAWLHDGMKVTTDDEGKLEGMSMDDYHNLLKTEKLVLVDFYATWCGPCKKMSPFLKEIAEEQAEKLELVQIDADKNTLVAATLQISALPTLLLYKGEKLVWSQKGYIDKDALLKKISTFD